MRDEGFTVTVLQLWSDCTVYSYCTVAVYRHFYPTALSCNPLKGYFVWTLDLRCSYSRFFSILWLAYFDYLIIISYATLVRLLRNLEVSLVESSNKSDLQKSLTWQSENMVCEAVV